MKTCLKRKGERFITLILIFLGISLIILSMNSYNRTDISSDRMLWEQSTERQLQEQVESYSDHLYERYSRIERDLTNYQTTTNERLDFLYERLNRLESIVSELESRVDNICNKGNVPNED